MNTLFNYPGAKWGMAAQIVSLMPPHRSYDGDSFEAAEKRMEQIMDVGFLPFAMLYRDESGRVDVEWKRFQREWANAFIVGKKFSDFRVGMTE